MLRADAAVRASGIAVVFVSHNLSAISSLCDRVLVLRQGQVQALTNTHDALTLYASLVQRRSSETNSQEFVLRLSDESGRPTREVEAGEVVRATGTAHPMPAGELFYTELQVRHLESGNLVYRCQSKNIGAEPIRVRPPQGLCADWSFTANLGRGHYAVTCVLLNEYHRWVAVSNPELLTVNERETEQAIPYLAPSCRVRAVSDFAQESTMSIAGR